MPARYPKNRECWCEQLNSGDPGAFAGDPICQHGDEECKGNAIEACAISQAGSSAKAWPFLLCYEGANRGSPDALNACATDAGLDALAIKDCSDGDAARSLLEDAARATQASS